ncbi:MAG: methionine gamma-lyase [Gammaproteobacteria bacterium]|jgi:methionine-gamma-lyase|nr:methionine gamma-lyase [Gammaproteobacteria bacterium]
MHHSNRNSGFATRAIHHGYDSSAEQGALIPPLHLTSTFTFTSAEQGGARFAGDEDGHIYSRISNPTLTILEQRLASLEGAEAGLATASGMGAITALLWSLLSPGDEIIADMTLYGCTFEFMHAGLKRFGINIKHVDMTMPDQLAAAISERTKVVYFETPANPNMRLIDIAAIAAIARQHHATSIVDNTYATPTLSRPIELGADVVVHSATKYLGGHGDLIGGLLAGSTELVDHVRMHGLKDMTGAVMSPFTAHLIMRGLKTLELRMQRHCQSAMLVASMLENHAAVDKVFYPGLASFPQQQLARAQMADFGGMIAFELHGGMDAGIRFMNSLQLIQRAVSLGDAETLIQHPASMTHSTYTAEERSAHGISDGLIRLSVGLETVADILDDLNQALHQQRNKAA